MVRVGVGARGGGRSALLPEQPGDRLQGDRDRAPRRGPVRPGRRAGRRGHRRHRPRRRDLRARGRRRRHDARPHGRSRDARGEGLSRLPGESQKVIDISAKTLDPQESEDVANAFADAYVAELSVIRDGQLAALDARRQALAEQLAGVTTRLVANPRTRSRSPRRRPSSRSTRA
ncbi:hypothetical protein NKG05_19645 [Oerskovia sp. M15]